MRLPRHLVARYGSTAVEVLEPIRADKALGQPLVASALVSATPSTSPSGVAGVGDRSGAGSGAAVTRTLA